MVHDPKRESLVLQKIRDLQMKSNDTPQDEMVNICLKLSIGKRSLMKKSTTVVTNPSKKMSKEQKLLQKFKCSF